MTDSIPKAADPLIVPVSVVIEISESNEDPTIAISSAVACAAQGLVRDVHIVQWGYERENPKWQHGLAELRKAEIPFDIHSTLDTKKLQCSALVRMEPDLHVSDGAMRLLIEQMRTQSVVGSFGVGLAADHFAVTSTLWIEPVGKLTPTTWINAVFAYGWLLVVYVLDSLRYMMNMGCYHRNVDLTGRFVASTYPNRVVLAPHRWWSPWITSGIARPVPGNAGCVLLPNAEDQGMTLLLRLLKTHRHMGFGICWFLFFVLYYAMFSFPWWTLVLHKSSIPFWWMPVTVDVRQWAWYWLTLQAVHLLVVAIVSSRQLHIPWNLQALHVLLYPLFLATAPPLFLYARYANSTANYLVIAKAHVKEKIN